MGTEISTTKNNAVAAGGNPWAEAAKGADSGFVGKFVKFNGKTGDWIAGQDEDELEPGTQIVVDFDLIQAGYICWVDEEPVDEQMAFISSGEVIAKSDLKDHGPYETYDDGSSDGWRDQHAMPFVLDDADDTDAYLFKTSSMGGIKALKKLYKQYAKEFQTQVDDEGNTKLPLIELDGDSYKSKKKKVGTIHVPVLTIVDWVERAEFAERLEALSGGAASKSEDEGNAGGGRKRKADADTGNDAEEDEAPARGRGRKQKAGDGEVEADGIEPADYGDDAAGEADEPQDEAPRGRGRKAGTGGASGGRARKFA